MTAPPRLSQSGLQAGPDYRFVQNLADNGIPLGFCNVCVGEARLAEAEGQPEQKEVHAAVTMILSMQQVPVPGVGTQVVVVPMPACWDHINVNRVSGLIQGAVGVAPPR